MKKITQEQLADFSGVTKAFVSKWEKEYTVFGFIGQTATNRLIGYLPNGSEFYSFMAPKEYLHMCG